MLGTRLTFCDVDGVAGESSSLPHERSLLWKQVGHFSADELVRRGFLAVRMEFVLVGDIPRPGGATLVVGSGLRSGGVLCLLGVEGVAVEVFSRADFASAASGVDLEDGVLLAVDIGINT